MRLELGAGVRSADDHAVGTVDQLVIDASTRAVTNFILRVGRFHNHDFLVPLAAVAREDGDNTLRLTLSAEQVRALPEFISQNFVVAGHTEETQWRYLVPTGMGAGTVPETPGGRTVDGMRRYDPGSDSIFGVEDPTDETVLTETSLGEWDYRESRGTKVVTRDDHTVGTLHEVDVDAAGQPQAIVVATGLLHHGRRTIPSARVRSADSQQILLNMTKAEYDALDAQPAP